MFALLLDQIDQSFGRRIVYPGASSQQFRIDRLAQHLAQFDTPLIERVDLPDNTLSKRLVFVQRKQRPEAVGRQRVEQDRRRWTIAGE